VLTLYLLIVEESDEHHNGISDENKTDHAGEADKSDHYDSDDNYGGEQFDHHLNENHANQGMLHFDKMFGKSNEDGNVDETDQDLEIPQII